MSYILDALKKSDQQRRLGQTPTLQDVPEMATAVGTRPPGRWIGVVAGLGLLAAGILIGWLQPWQSEAPDAVQPPTGTHQAVTAGAEPVLGTEPVTDLAPRNSHAHQETQDNQAALTASAANEPVTAHQPAQRADWPEMAPASPADSTAIAGGRGQDSSGGVPEKRGMEAVPEQLPGGLQSELPQLTIAFHAYAARPADRRVMINGEMLRQGETFASGLRVDEITPDGVILGYKGFRFRRSVR